MPYANNKGTGQPAHLCSLISAFVFRCLDSMGRVMRIWYLWPMRAAKGSGRACANSLDVAHIILLVSISEISSLYPATMFHI